MSTPRHTCIPLLATLLLAACTPQKATVSDPGGALAAAPAAGIEQHQRQVEQDAQAFIAFQQGQGEPPAATTRTPESTEPVIEWNRRETTAAATSTSTDESSSATAAAQSEPIATTAPAPATAAEATLRRTMIDFSRELYTGSTWSDQPMKELLVLASMSMLDPSRALDANAIPDLTSEERELLAAMQSWFTTVGEDLGADSDPWAVLLGASDQLQRKLKRIPDLKLPSVALCTRVSGFGDYDEWSDRADEDATYTFIAHNRQPVIIYAEMEGFESELNDRELWETVTSQHLTIYSDRDGIPVWKEDWQTAADRSQNQRRDYFTVQQLMLPTGLSVGKYHLKLRVRDEKSGAEVERNIPFTMTAGVLD